MNNRVPREGMKVARLLMVLSSISPLFVLWAIRGVKHIPDVYVVGFCMLMVAIPNLALWFRIATARTHHDKRPLVIGLAEDHRDHLLVYLFAMLLPFYPVDLGDPRDLAATLVALAFIVFLFWHLNLHYMNVFFALLGFRVFTIYPPADNNRLTGKAGQVLITRRVSLHPGDRVEAYRISDTVYMEFNS